MVEKNENVRAVGRALEILLAFTPQDSALTAAELLKRVDLSRPTLYRFLYTLQELGLLVGVGDPQRFRLGPAVAKLAHSWAASLDLASVADTVLRALWGETRETVALFVPQGEYRLCVAELPSLQPLNFKRGVGFTERLVYGATGRAILAFMNHTPSELRKFVQGTSVQYKDLVVRLEETRKRGYATSHSELIDGAVALAVPFFDHTGAVKGSIGVFGPEVRLPRAKQAAVIELLVKYSGELSHSLGFGNTVASNSA